MDVHQPKLGLWVNAQASLKYPELYRAGTERMYMSLDSLDFKVLNWMSWQRPARISSIDLFVRDHFNYMFLWLTGRITVGEPDLGVLFKGLMFLDTSDEAFRIAQHCSLPRNVKVCLGWIASGVRSLEEKWPGCDAMVQQWCSDSSDSSDVVFWCLMFSGLAWLGGFLHSIFGCILSCWSLWPVSRFLLVMWFQAQEFLFVCWSFCLDGLSWQISVWGHVQRKHDASWWKGATSCFESSIGSFWVRIQELL